MWLAQVASVEPGTRLAAGAATKRSIWARSSPGARQLLLSSSLWLALSSPRASLRRRSALSDSFLASSAPSIGFESRTQSGLPENAVSTKPANLLSLDQVRTDNLANAKPLKLPLLAGRLWKRPTNDRRFRGGFRASPLEATERAEPKRGPLDTCRCSCMTMNTSVKTRFPEVEGVRSR